MTGGGRTWRVLVVVGLLAWLAGACGDDEGGDRAGAGRETLATSATMKLTSEAFAGGETMPERFSRDGGNLSPPLRWTGVPAETVELVLVVDDPDAPGDRPFLHWLVAGISSGDGGIGEGDVPAGAVEGVNDFGDHGWSGPDPPGGKTHRYVFTLTALGRGSGLEPGFEREDLGRVIETRRLATATLTGRFRAR